MAISLRPHLRVTADRRGARNRNFEFWIAVAPADGTAAAVRLCDNLGRSSLGRAQGNAGKGAPCAKHRRQAAERKVRNAI
jgi:hypothetical protein